MDTELLKTAMDRVEIDALKAAYCDACDDDHNGEAVASLFLPDGVWEFVGRPPQVGTGNIRTHFLSIRESGEIACSAHLLSNGVVEVTGDTATARWRFQMIYTDPRGAGHQIIGRYEDHFQRTAEGWRFSVLRATVEQRHDLAS